MPRTVGALVVICSLVASTAVGVVAQTGDPRARDAAVAASTLSTVEMLLGWGAPTGAIDLRVMSGSGLGIAPLPVVRLTGATETDIAATVTEWGRPLQEPLPPGHRAFTLLRPPPICADDGAVCAGQPIVARGTPVKAVWFALILARGCTGGPRQVLSDTEDLYVRGVDRGVEVDVFCSRPQRVGPTPADRQAAAVLRMLHTLLGRYPVRERRH